MSAVYLFILLLLAGVIGIVIVAHRRLNSLTAAVAGLGSAGIALALIGFLTQPWVVPASASNFERNLDWLGKQAGLLTLLNQLPVIKDRPLLLTSVSSASLRSFLEQTEAGPYLRYLATGRPLYGWDVWRLSWTISPGCAIGLTAAFLAVLGTATTLIVFLTASEAAIFRGGALMGVLALLGLVPLMGCIATIDTLGSSDFLAIRVAAALAQARIGPGPWWVLLGLVILVCFGVLCYVHSRTSTLSKMDEEEPFSDHVFTGDRT